MGHAGDVTNQRYPWGNAFDPRKANTWDSGIGDTVAVAALTAGSTPNGVRQLIGNVWEWVDAQFHPNAETGVSVTLDQTMAEIRGGAFDTYFHSQATCQFRTGQPLLFRGPNVGFRCCVSGNTLTSPEDSQTLRDGASELNDCHAKSTDQRISSDRAGLRLLRYSACGKRRVLLPLPNTGHAFENGFTTRVGSQNFVSVLGPSNAGKTVYLGLLLDILSKGSEEFRGTATSAFSVDLLEQVVTALERRSFPEKTPSEADAWKWLHCQISIAEKKSTRNVDLISPDFAGEAIAMEVNQAGIFPAIQHVVRKSSGLMILCDSMRVRDAGSGEDLFAMKLASYIAQASRCGKRWNIGPFGWSGHRHRLHQV